MFYIADKKIKVDADVTIRKNVSSGIGKGFGTVIGAFLAIIVIAIFIGVVISSNANKIEEQANQVFQNYEQEVEKEAQKIAKQIEEQTGQYLNDITPTNAQSGKFKFSPDSIVETKNGISLSLDDLKYEIKGENWGKITEITISILNKGNDNLDPKVLVLLHDEKDPSEDKILTKAEIEFDYLFVGEHTTKKAITDISFNDIDLSKTLKVVLVRAFDYNNRAIVVIEKEFIAE